MSNRSHLVPTPTVTKNGVQTTVYVKPGATNGVSLPPVAKPDAAGARRMELEYDTAKALVSSGWYRDDGDGEDDREDSYQRCRETFKSYSSETLHMIMEKAETEMSSGLLSRVAYDKSPEKLLIDWMMFKPEGGSSHQAETAWMARIDPILLGFAHYPHMAPQDEPETRRAQGNAILRLIDKMADKGFSFITSYSNVDRQRVVHIADEGIRDLITTYPDPDAVADLIIERDITDAEQLAGILEGMTRTGRTLRDGVL
jgi:hypothetical protein